MTYKQSITAAMDELAKDPDVVFIGYGITRGKAMGTLANVPAEKLVEFPVAENLMVGAAIGMSLRGRKPVVFIERCDFLLNAMDAIVNHLVKIDVMSRGQFKPAIILRVVVGNSEKPLFTGETHVQDFSKELRLIANEGGNPFPKQSHFFVERLGDRETPCNERRIRDVFYRAHECLGWGQSTAVFEYKDQY